MRPLLHWSPGQVAGWADLGLACDEEALVAESDGPAWQLWDNVNKFVCALDDADGGVVTAHNHRLTYDASTGEVHECPDGCLGGLPITRERFAALLLVASAFPPGTDIATTAFGLDSTDYETWAKRRSWDRLPDIDKEDGAEHPVDVRLEDDRRTAGWPRRGHDGRAQHTVDRDGREGYRSGKNLAPKGVFIGFDIHLATLLPEFGSPPVPHVTVSLVTAPAGSSKSAAGLAALDALNGLLQVSTVVNDRGYSHLRADTWALQLAARNIHTVFDLQSDQLGVHPGPIPGTIWVDGGLFTDALPAHLRKLGPFTLKMTKAERAALHARYDERIPYSFAYYGPADPVTGARRVRGPVLRGLLRCSNAPASLRLSRTRPRTHCPTPKKPIAGKKSEVPCGCSKSTTLQVDEHAWTKQIDVLWGTTKHAASYGRRPGIESVNADLKHNRGIHLHRGFTRVFGAAKNHALLVFAVVGVNVRHLRDWHARHLRRDPWMAAIGDTSDPDWAAVHAHRKRKPRHMALHERMRLGMVVKSPISARRNRRPKGANPTSSEPGTKVESSRSGPPPPG